MTTKIVRLSTGEELLCEIESKDESTLTLKKVGILIPKQTNELGIAPFMAYSKDEAFDIGLKDIMFIVDPVADLAAQHHSMFSPIVLMNK